MPVGGHLRADPAEGDQRVLGGTGIPGHRGPSANCLCGAEFEAGTGLEGGEMKMGFALIWDKLFRQVLTWGQHAPFTWPTTTGPFPWRNASLR